MKNMQLYDMFETVILSISNGRINKKALNETLHGFEYKFMMHPFDGDSFNYALFSYYQKVHRQKTLHSQIAFMNLYCTSDYEFIKRHYNAKRYKNKYDYSIMNLQPIRQKDTAFGIEYKHSNRNESFSYAFDMLKFIRTNNIHVQINEHLTFK